ncbi:hypothetical protein K491DRAFT_696292 [Lophiostoma macrostomum CBS 122681]|uniref:Uncharacterized protein n=1 Tax=Lophiostoma macrostomum CBS 122681 TaxID=1314788 RepID=A0A6A6SV30_9PLEO|nr:hypothetical protein K491DRAFT_696292 [Lophiostoma macrostomum CBS 122681]
MTARRSSQSGISAPLCPRARPKFLVLSPVSAVVLGTATSTIVCVANRTRREDPPNLA